MSANSQRSSKDRTLPSLKQKQIRLRRTEYDLYNYAKEKHHKHLLYKEEAHQKSMLHKEEAHQKAMQQIEERHKKYMEQQEELHQIEVECKKKQLENIKLLL